MNKILRFSMLSLMLMLVGVMYAKEVTFLPSEFTAAENSDYSLTKDGVTMTVTASTVTDSQFRIFKGQSITFSATGNNLTSIVFTCTANGTAKYGPGNFTTAEGYTFSEDGNQGFWSGNTSTLTLTAEAAQVRVTEIVVTVGEGGGENPTPDPQPEVGSASNPFTVAQAQALLATLDANVKSEQVYAKGLISKIDQVDPSYGNATFYISDNGTEDGQLEVYRAVFLEKAKFTSEDQIKVGDEVIICGQLVNYRSSKAADTDPVTPEFTSGCYIYSLNGVTKNGETPEPQPSGEVKTVTIADFNAAAESTDVWYQLTGTVKNLKDGDIYGNFDLEDETGSVYVYGVLSEKGGEKKLFQELAAAKGIKNGCKLTIIGNRGSYKDKIEVLNAYFVSVEEGGETPEPQPADEVKTVTIADFNAAAESTDVWYQLTGTVKNLKDGDIYGNFDLEDETGSVYVYGLLSEKGGAKKLFQELAAAQGIKEGSKITIIGNRGSYKEKIEVTNAYFVSIAEEVAGLVWDFTKWSDATVAALKADAAASKVAGWSDVEKKADAESDADPTETSKDNCFWSVAETNADGTLSANGVVIEELKGLVFNNEYTTARSLAIAVNYPSALSDYAGGAYLWLGGKGKFCFSIPNVAAGSTITMEVESHKASEGRGVELRQGGVQFGEKFTPTTKASYTWTVETAGDVEVWNTNGCHIYKIVVSEPTAVKSVTLKPVADGYIYNLRGQRVENPTKGIYIRNGKKFVVK